MLVPVATGGPTPTVAGAASLPSSYVSGAPQTAEQFKAWVEGIREEAGPSWLRIFNSDGTESERMPSCDPALGSSRDMLAS